MAYGYSNMGTNTLGRVVEVVAGKPFETFLQTRIFDPLGMIDTTFCPDAARLERLVTAYGPDERSTAYVATRFAYLTYPFDDRRRYPAPGGGLFSTVADLARFCRMILNGGDLGGHRFVTRDAIAEMSRRQTPPNDPVAYGLQWNVYGRRFGHGGAGGTNMILDPDLGVAVLYMTQLTGHVNGGEAAQATIADAIFDALA